MLRQGDVPAGSTVQADIPGFQAVIKNRWPDGSAKFAILSGHADLSANTWRTLTLKAGAVPDGQGRIPATAMQASGVAASMQFGAFGTAAWSGSDWATPLQTVASGPEMSVFTYRKPIGSDDHLVAWLEVRAYKSGRFEVLPWIENGYLRKAGPGPKSGVATFTLNGASPAQRFSQTLNLLNHQRAVLASGTTLTHWFGGDPQLTPRPDTAYLMATRLVPNYRGTTPQGSTLYGRLAASYTPLAQAGFPGAMGSAGYDGSIGLLPEWDAAYFTTGGDPRAWRAVMINGYAAGRYGTHYRDETTNRPLSFASYPNLVMGSGSAVNDIGGASTGAFTPAATGAAPPTYASSHHPSMGYLAYLLSGWNYFAEETQLLATANYLKQPDRTRQFSAGVFETITGSNTTRGAAWALRTLAQAATVTPDDDPLRAQFVASVDANVQYYHAKYVAQPNNPLGLVQPYSDYYPGNGVWTSAPWMDDFFTAASGWLKELQVASSANAPKLDAFLAWKYRSVVGRLGGQGGDAIAYPYGTQYTVPYAPSETADWRTGTGPWYASWGDAARAANLATTAAAGAPLVSGYAGDPTSYWGNLMPALAYAVDHNAAGAAEAWARVTAASNFGTLARGFDNAPVWGVKPRVMP
jgi:hypothetical protein